MAINFLTQAGEAATAAGPLDSVIVLLQQFGFFRVVLPFLLVFTIFYAVLIKTGIFGKPEDKWVKPAAGVVSLVVGFLVIAYTPVVSAIETVLPQAGFLLVMVILVLMVLGLIGFPVTEKFTDKMSAMAIIIGIVVVLIFITLIGAAIGPSVPILYGISQFMLGFVPVDLPAISEEAIALLVAAAVLLLVIGGIIYLVTR
jgi:hypothetical protein